MKRVFILDDNEELLEIMTRLLKKEFEVMCSTETDHIDERIISFKPDILILDHTIGEVNSGDIIGKLKIADPHFGAPVILFSAHPQLENIMTTVGANGFIDKPSDISHIRNYIREKLNMHPENINE